MICFLVFTAILIGRIQTVTVTISNQQPSSSYLCYSDLVLRCEVSGSACCGNTKLWTKNGKSINTVSNSKYSQELFASASYFTLTIKDLLQSDLGADYSCGYSIAQQSTFSLNGSIYCFKCGGLCFSWILIGVVAAFCLTILIIYKTAPKSDKIYKKPGSTVIFNCQYKDTTKKYGLLWLYKSPTSQGWTTYSSKTDVADVPAKPRITITGAFDAGEYILNIKDLRESDSGYYRCALGDGQGDGDPKELIVTVKSKWNKKKMIVSSLVSILISLMVSSAIAVPVCTIYSLCLESLRLDPLFILLGAALEVGLFFLVAVCYDNCGS